MFQGIYVPDVVERSLKTFIQTALATVVAAGTGYVDVATWKAAVVGAGAAALSALYNGINNARASKTGD